MSILMFLCRINQYSQYIHTLYYVQYVLYDIIHRWSCWQRIDLLICWQVIIFPRDREAGRFQNGLTFRQRVTMSQRVAKTTGGEIIISPEAWALWFFSHLAKSEHISSIFKWQIIYFILFLWVIFHSHHIHQRGDIPIWAEWVVDELLGSFSVGLMMDDVSYK